MIDNFRICNYTIPYIWTQRAFFGGKTTNGKKMECDNSNVVRG